MNKKLKCTNIIQAENRGTITFTELDKDKKPVTVVAVQFNDPKEAAKYEHGKEYTITINQK